ncbi:MAG: S41 family peptidase [Alteraurantiacibacter sp.]
MKTIVIAAALALPAAPLFAQDYDPAAVVDATADAVEEYFYDAERGSEIASEVRAYARANAAQIAAADAFALAEMLTGLLSPFDGHFGVTYRPSSPATDADEATPPQGYGYMEELGRRGGGFSAVEILPGNIGLVTMDGFATIDFDDPADPVKASADAVLGYVGQADAVIVDLRDNGGGAPHMVGYMTSAFVPHGSDVYNTFLSREGMESEAPGVEFSAPMTDTPLYMLISPRTGSAAESLAYTLQATGRGTVIGQASAGAANPGGGTDLGQGFELFVSTGSPRNPFTGTNWEGDGVQPDVVTTAGDELRTAQLLAYDAVEDSIPEAHRIDLEWMRETLTAMATGEGHYAGIYGDIVVTCDTDGLALQIDERHPVRLLPVATDLFARADWPLERFRFLRGADGAVTGIERSQANGWVRRYMAQ